MMKKRKIYLTVTVIAAAAAVVCAAFAVRQYRNEKEAGSGYEQIREEVKAVEPPPAEPEEASKPSVEIPIDFESLQKRNPDVYAWITVPGTQIDYPILQRENDNTYYLTHTIDHEEKTEGAIFTENYNSIDFEDPNTVIYGHDMKNGTMFRSLLEYQDREFFEENKEIIIYTPDAIRYYEIFAAYPYDNRHILRSFNLNDKNIFKIYLESIFSVRNMNSCIDTSMEVDTDDKIVTLSTCYGSRRDQRYLVQAVLVSIDK